VSRLRRWLGLARIALSLLRHERARTALAVTGVALAVLASVLLVSVGLGVVATGEQKFDQSGRDLWVSGGPVEIQPGAVGGFENSLVGAHEVEAQLIAREDIETANPFVFQTVYASPSTSDFDTIIGVGAGTGGSSVNIIEGRAIEHGDRHYGNGNYNGSMGYEVLVDEDVARQYNVSVNDTLYLGSTLATAREHEFTVVGITNTFSQFVGAPTVVMPPSEMQEISGLTSSDRAAFLTIQVAEDADLEATAARLDRAYPEYTIRTNREQLQATVADQAVVIASGVSLVALAVVAGILLLTNLQLSFVARHRETFGALSALGTSQSSLVLVVVLNTLSIGVLGGAIGSALAVPGIWGINRVAEVVSGFENVVSVSEPVLAGGFVVSVAVSLLGGIVATLYLGRMRPLEHLR
jgi:putative ABC transport system permease protein